jgi:L-cysteate sulfo-lyase
MPAPLIQHRCFVTHRDLARQMLGFFPTPIHELTQLGRLLGGPRIFIKRDDLTGLACGGNKTRKLEFLVGQALAEGADTLITAGAIQSNHCRQTAAAAASLGLEWLPRRQSIVDLAAKPLRDERLHHPAYPCSR